LTFDITVYLPLAYHLRERDYVAVVLIQAPRFEPERLALVSDDLRNGAEWLSAAQRSGFFWLVTMPARNQYMMPIDASWKYSSSTRYTEWLANKGHGGMTRVPLYLDLYVRDHELSVGAL
jgi:hypothetical protein